MISELERRIRLTLKVYEKINYFLKNKGIPINLKRKGYVTCVLAVATYDLEKLIVTKQFTNYELCR